MWGWKRASKSASISRLIPWQTWAYSRPNSHRLLLWMGHETVGKHGTWMDSDAQVWIITLPLLALEVLPFWASVSSSIMRILYTYIIHTYYILQTLNEMPCIKYLVCSIDTWKCCFPSFRKHPELADVIQQFTWLLSWVILLYQSAVSSSGVTPPLTILNAIMCSHLRR